MPQKEQVIAINDLPSQNVLPLVVQTVTDLNWEITFADTKRIVAQTTPNAIKGVEVTFVHSNNALQVTSKQINGEMLDIGNRNQKSLNAFTETFNSNKNRSDEVLENYAQQLQAYQEATIVAVEKHNKEMEEVHNVMHLGSSNLYATYVIMAINVIVFILMVLDGAGVIETNGYVHLKWGSNFGPLTLSGDWWRLITCTFIHFGIIHIAMNMYCLYTVGIYLEPMLGKVKYVAAYLCTGVIASIVSLWWHTTPANSAGASGAVFGMYGLFLAFLTSNIIPKAVRDELLKSIGIFVVYNLAYGMKSGVDNAAHIGGLVSGFIIGYIFILARKKESPEVKLNWIVPGVLVLTGAIAFFYLQNNKEKNTDRVAILNEIKSHSGNYKDLDKYDEAIQKFGILEKDAVSFLGDSTLTDDMLKNKIETIGFPNWSTAKDLMNRVASFDIAPELQKRSKTLVTYIEYRIKEDSTLLQYIEGKNQQQAILDLNAARENIGNILEQINAQ
jgi:rhomboid protease GluP